MTKKIAIVLAGCGAKDGSEIHEAVCTLLALDQQGAKVQCFAPDIPQAHVVNHITGAEMPGEKRNVLLEAARICRGKIMPLSEYSPADFDALIFPGGFGAAKNLFTLAFDGPDFSINADVERAVLSTHAAQKPIGALCISPALLAKLIPGARVTLGQDTETAQALGADHVTTTHGEITIDEKNKLITTPCYMLDAHIANIYDGASNLVKAVLERA